MALIVPKTILKRKYSHKIDYRGESKGNKKIHWGQFGLQAEEGYWISNRQIEAARKVLSHYVKSYGKIFINIFPFLPKTKKPLEVRMGSGKGSVESWVAVIKRGTVMFEIKLNDLKYGSIAQDALKKASYKLPIRCRVLVQSQKENP